jgi:hypothetical protein
MADKVNATIMNINASAALASFHFIHFNTSTTACCLYSVVACYLHHCQRCVMVLVLVLVLELVLVFVFLKWRTLTFVMLTSGSRCATHFQALPGVISFVSAQDVADIGGSNQISQTGSCYK